MVKAYHHIKHSLLHHIAPSTSTSTPDTVSATLLQATHTILTCPTAAGGTSHLSLGYRERPACGEQLNNSLNIQLTLPPGQLHPRHVITHRLVTDNLE
jgi:hypothetical protein